MILVVKVEEAPGQKKVQKWPFFDRYLRPVARIWSQNQNIKSQIKKLFVIIYIFIYLLI